MRHTPGIRHQRPLAHIKRRKPRISVEPLIDMGRTALNVNGSMTAGAITSQIMQQTDKELLNADDHAELAQA